VSMSVMKRQGDFPTAPPPTEPGGPAGEPIPTTGVIFVHGIGSQNAGDTLLQWASPLIEILTAWKTWAVPGTPIRDPVDLAQVDFKGGQARIEIDIPAVEVDGRAFARHRWILTEAWWAAKIAPPSLSTMTSWLGPQGGAGQIVDAILGNRTDSGRLAFVFRGFVTPFVTILAGLILTGYALLRGISLVIPIDSVKNAAILQTFDNFLTGWFGDARILLFDPAQSANIRAGLAAAIRTFNQVDKVDHVVVMAHSGGAMVSYLMLVDPTYQNATVDKLITFGEGFNLALTLTPGGRGMFDRLRTDVTAENHRPHLLWRDFWGSHDPAPAGMVRFAELNGGAGAEHPEHIRSRQVWNRRSLLDDHGSYFENDEEFTLAVLREIDQPTGWGETPTGALPVSRFFPTPPANDDSELPPADPRERRHRERVAILALMRHLAVATAIGTITAVLASATRLSDLGRGLGELIGAIPIVHDLGAAIVPFMERLRLPVLSVDHPPFGLATISLDANGLIDLVGLATLQAIVLISILQLIFAPVRAFDAWPTTDVRRWLFLGTEVAIDIGLVLAVVILAVAPSHPELLGAGVRDWQPGIGLTLITLAVAAFGTRVTGRLPSITRLYTGGATIVFVAAMVSSVIVMFRRPNLEHGELGYVVIWASFLILYRIGHDRWSQWDRVERHAAYAESPNETRSRVPVWISMAGFVAAGLAVILWVLPELSDATVVFTGLAIVLIVVAIVVGARLWPDEGNPITNLQAVESARGNL
jgi:hypothetical protein